MSPLRLAWANMFCHWVRTAIAVCGVAFAVLLVFMELGFAGAVRQTATQLYDCLDFDLLLVSPEQIHLTQAGELPRQRLAQAGSVAGVVEVLPVSIGVGSWRDPRPESDPPRRWNILMLGVEPDRLASLFVRPTQQLRRSRAELAASGAALARLDTVLLDLSSWPEYGVRGGERPTFTTELNNRRVEVVGDFRLGTGFGYNGLLIASEATFARVTGRPPDRVTLGLVRLADQADPAAVQARLQQLLAPEKGRADVEVLSRAEVRQRERRYWEESTPVGRFFALAVVVAFAVGVVFVYQIMAGDIRLHVSEYATVKALGYPSSYLRRVILRKPLLIALAGYLPGLLAAVLCCEWTRASARIPLFLDGQRAGFVLGLTVIMCLCSGLLALRRIHTADPADLF